MAPQKRKFNDGASTTKKRAPVITAASSRPIRSVKPALPPTSKGTKEKKAKAKTGATKAENAGSVDLAASSPMINDASAERLQSEVSVRIPPPKEETDEETEDGPAYWLMKAEPESRIEKGKDIKFSIDDLKNALVPEAWDGVRNPAARNNMRAMIKGDLAFFYHSNCKVPGIVGIMEVVQEHSVDESAFDPEHPYYDPKSTRDAPKWCIVNVEFRQKFPEIISLKEMQKYAKNGGVLERMQVIKQSRLSVSKVTKKEWDFLISLLDTEDDRSNDAGNDANPNIAAKKVKPNNVDEDANSNDAAEDANSKGTFQKH